MGDVSQWILQPTGMVWAPDDVNIHTRGTGQPLCVHYLPLHSVERTELVDRHTCELLHTGASVESEAFH